MDSSFSNIKKSVNHFWRQEVLTPLANLKLAIILLLMIAGASISGTVIEQGKSVTFYQENYPEAPALFGFLSWKVILALGLDDVYRTGWFLGLLIIFGSSLLACTMTRQMPMLRKAQRWSYYTKPRQFHHLALSTAIENSNFTTLVPLLQKRRYRIFQEGNTLYARKGIVGRIGPILVHASMLFILLGAIWGSLTGFTAMENVLSGDSFQVQHIRKAGSLAQSRIPKNWFGKVNSFWIDYNSKGGINQFYSDISLLDGDKHELTRKTIYVNQPLRYQGVTLYQTNWNIGSIKVQLNNSPVIEVPTIPLKAEDGSKLWAGVAPTKPDRSEGVVIMAKDLQGTVLVYGEDDKNATALRVGMAAEVKKGLTLKIVEVVGSTGLEIKADPGIPLVYLGFGALMLGAIASYVSHTQVWALQQGETLYVGGRTNRAQLTFEQEMIAIISQLQNGVSVPGSDRLEEEKQRETCDVPRSLMN